MQLKFIRLRLPFMKKIIYIFLVIISGIYSLLFSCKREDKAMPVAAFNPVHLNECGIPDTISFENLSLNASVFRWNFGDTSPAVYENNPVHIYNHEGVYNVELTAYGNGGMHTEIIPVYIVKPPVIDFTVSDTIINVNGSVTFNGVTSSGVLPSTWFWTFGDGNTANTQNCSHQYSAPGIYDVTMTAINACGSTFVEKKKLIKVNSLGAPPVADFTANNVTINAGQFVNFTDLSVNSPDTWNWTFSGASPGNSTVQNPVNIQYNNPGYYDVSLNVTNAFGSNNLTKTGYIHVLATAPTVVFIKKITIKQMYFPESPLNLFYKINDVPPSGVIYVNGMSQVQNGVYQSSLPVFWNLNPYYQLPVLNHDYQITLWHRKVMPLQELPAGYVQFNPSALTSYPSVLNLTQNGINMDVELQWQ